MTDKFDLMIIAPHPDDPEFGIGGTVAQWTKDGKRVIYIICTNGNKGTDDPAITPAQLSEIRRAEQMDAARALGVTDVVFLEHDDQSIEDTPEFRKELVKVLRTYKPDVVAAPDPYRKYIWHRDHRNTGQVVLDAVYPFARDRLAYPDLILEGYQPHKVKELLFWGAEQPNHFIDITNTFDNKISALKCHKSQVSHFPQGWEDAYRTVLSNYGKEHGYDMAETFYRVVLPP
jgi:LmbE family N-acetylglucosaminyl deacetylase